MDRQLQSLSDLKRKARHDKDEQDDTSQKRRFGDTSSISVNPVPQGEAHREGGSTPSLLSHDAYTVGWVWALPKEQTAAKAMLDRLHTRLRQPPSDTNAYTLGSIGDHNIVIACLPKGQVGTVSAANVASSMISTFPSIRFALMVGIGGGIPSKVRLGDVVVGTPTDTYPGVVQWDMGKATEGGNFNRTGTLNNPPTSLLTALTQIETDHDMVGSKIPDHLGQLQQRYPRLASKYLRSDSFRDVFFSSGSKHIDDCKGTCLLCDKTSATERELEDTRVHFGLIASGNQVIKDGIFRDRLDRDLGGNVLCVEMEAVGLVTNFPCLVIRGICDYADSHKNKDWQEHSAATAAAFAKELLGYVEPAMIKAEPSANDDVVRTTFVNVERLGRSIATKEDLAILDWISPSTYGCQQSDIFERHQSGTGQWFLESTAFRDWRETPGKTLFCPGIPGSGKTIMTSVAINFLMKILGDERGMALAYVYCDYNKQAQQTLHHLLTSMLKQVCQTQEKVPEAAKELYNRHKEVGTTPSLNEIIATLKAASSSCSRVFILVDALDEFGTLDNRRCLKDCRFAFLSHLAEVQEAAKINILYTSRHNAGIEEAIGSCLRQEIRAADEDIYRFIDSNLENVLKPIPPTPGLHDAIKTTIMGLVDGMFLLAQLFLDSLRGKTTASQIREALAWIEDRNQTESKDEENTGILYQAYDQAMTRIQEQLPGHRDLGMKTLAWIINTERPLTSLELQHALAIKKGQKYLDQEDTSKIEVILSVCAGLVILDKESDIIRLAHFTTQEYFTWKQHFPDAHVEIAAACTTYLSFENFEHATRGHSVRGRRKNPNNLHLSPYAAIHWANHVRKARFMNQSVLDFLIEEKGVKAACTYSEWQWRAVDPEATWTSLHVVAYHGLLDATCALIRHGFDIAATPSNSSLTPLLIASYMGFHDVVELLLDLGADLHAVDDCGCTSLLLASRQGCDTIVRLLLGRGADMCHASNLWNWNSLQYASANGHENVVRTLLDHGADIEATGFGNWTALHCAASNGHDNVVRLLLQRGASLENMTNDGRTPANVAFEGRHLGVMMTFATQGANIEAKDEEGVTSAFSTHQRESGDMHGKRFAGANHNQQMQAGFDPEDQLSICNFASS